MVKNAKCLHNQNRETQFLGGERKKQKNKIKTHIAETQIGHTKVWHEFMALMKAKHILSVSVSVCIGSTTNHLDSDIYIYFASVWLYARHGKSTFESTILSEPFSSVNL